MEKMPAAANGHSRRFAAEIRGRLCCSPTVRTVSTKRGRETGSEAAKAWDEVEAAWAAGVAWVVEAAWAVAEAWAAGAAWGLDWARALVRV